MVSRSSLADRFAAAAGLRPQHEEWRPGTTAAAEGYGVEKKEEKKLGELVTGCDWAIP